MPLAVAEFKTTYTRAKVKRNSPETRPRGCMLRDSLAAPGRSSVPLMKTRRLPQRQPPRTGLPGQGIASAQVHLPRKVTPSVTAGLS